MRSTAVRKSDEMLGVPEPAALCLDACWMDLLARA